MKLMLGKANHNVDSKNRLFIPAKFRESLGESFVIVDSAYDKCLRMYPFEEWERYIGKINDCPDLDDDQKSDILRAICENADTVSPDSQGRVIINATLKEFAEIEKSVVISGVGPYAELWSEANHEAKTEGRRAKDYADILKKIR